MPSSPSARLLSYNIHGCIGTSGQYDLHAIHAILRQCDADVVALQEVYDESQQDRHFLASLHQSQYPHIAYGPTLRHPQRGDYGNLLLSKWPIKHLDRLDLSIPNREPRGAIRAHIDAPGFAFDITATHLGLSRAERARQLDILLKHWGDAIRHASIRSPFVLMGDLNEWLPRSFILSKLEDRFGHTNAFRSFPSKLPLFSLDQIFARPRGIIRSIGTLQTQLALTASDHLPLLAEISPDRSRL